MNWMGPWAGANAGSFFKGERDMANKTKAKVCSICHEQYTGYGNNAQPLNNGRCCNHCNDAEVIPARIRAIQERDEPECVLECTGDDIFVVVNDVRIARRGYPGTPQAKTWVSLESGYKVLDGPGRNSIAIEYSRVEAH
jgi:hypothetical protein